MRKFTTIAVCVSMMLLVAAPAMAAALDVDGSVRVRGFSYSNQMFHKDYEINDSKYDMRFRMNGTIGVADNLKAKFRLDLFDYTWGDTTVDTPYTTMAVGAARGWIDYTSPYGKLEFGRMQGGAWGLLWGDYEGDFNRLKYTGRKDDIIFGGIIQKQTENDYEAGVSDADTDVYYLFGFKKMEKGMVGLLLAYARAMDTPSAEADKYGALPFCDINLGPIGALDNLNIKSELSYEFGTVKDNSGAGAADKDISAYNGVLEISGKKDKFGFELGYGYVSGQDAADLTKASPELTMSNTTYGGVGQDWDKFVYLTDTSGNAILNNYAGSAGAYAKAAAWGGVSLWWLGGSFAPRDNVSVSVLLGQATANETDTIGLAPVKWPGDDYGMEYDLRISWDITENLNYSFNFGFLDAGDAMAVVKGVDQFVAAGGNTLNPADYSDPNKIGAITHDLVGATTVDDGMKIYHKIELKF